MNKRNFIHPLSMLLLIPLIFSLFFIHCGKKTETPRVILLITIDTLRKDHLGCYGYNRDTSPFIDQLAQQGIVFENTITPLPLTDASHASILTSLHPLVHGVLINSTRLTEKVETIAEVMKKKGFYTIGAVSVKHLAREYHFSQGFDSYSDQCNVANKRGLKWTRQAETVNKSLFRQINQYKKKHGKKPLFLWIHYYDPHSPYIDWEHISFKTAYTGPSKHIEHYDKEIRYTDDAIRNLFAYLKKENLTSKLTVCITADHGEQLGEHDTDGGHNAFYSETVFVPLIFQGYGIAKNKRIDHYVSTMDIAPTLLSLNGFKFTNPVHGKVLLDKKGNPLAPPKTKREFMVIGNPNLNRSMQWICNPYSYILNFDYPHRYWYISKHSDFPDHKLMPIDKNTLSINHYKKSDKYVLKLDYPSYFRNQLYMGVLRFQLIENQGFSLYYQIGSHYKPGVTFQDKDNGTITAFFPVTPLDRLTTDFYFKKGTVLDNFRIALLPAKEVQAYLEPDTNVENLLFKKMYSPRKYGTLDELYNLEKDFAMKLNLVKDKHNSPPPQSFPAKRFLFQRLKHFQEEGEQLRGKARRNKALNKKEEAMLKSLGYL